MKIGYARVSTDGQSLDLQILALRKACCDKIFTDHGVSGGVVSRPGLDAALAELSPGGMLVVWKLDRLGRSLVHLVQLVNELAKRSIDFQSLTENIDTASSGGRLIFHVMAALAEFERALISERTRAGMYAARAAGRHVGRQASLTQLQCIEARLALDEGKQFGVVATLLHVHPKTLRRHLRLIQLQ